MTISVKISKKPLEHFQPSRWCEWCVEVETDDPNDFRHPDDDVGVPTQWAIDLPADTDILDPDIAKRIKGAPDYKIDPSSGEGTITQPGATEFSICFVAACEGRAGVEMSLEHRMDLPDGAFGDRSWRRVPFEDAPEGKAPIIGPAAVAMAPVQEPDPMAIIATFEAQKMAALMGIGAGAVASVPVPPAPTLAAIAAKADPGSRVIYVTGATVDPRAVKGSGKPGKKK